MPVNLRHAHLDVSPTEKRCALREKIKTNSKGNCMASYHASVKAGRKGKAKAHAQYVAREGKYRKLLDGEQLEAVMHGNMPAWAEHDPMELWGAADEFERANGTAYREYELALPNELSEFQRLGLVRDFVETEFGEKHAFTVGIHNKISTIGEIEQPHAHVMKCERTLDGIDRDPAQYFKRYNAKNPERGGCKKANTGLSPAERRADLEALRERWATMTNKHLELAGLDVRVDHRSLADQGIDRAPEKHLGPKLSQVPAIKTRLLNDRLIAAQLPLAREKLVAAEAELVVARAEADQIQVAVDLAPAPEVVKLPVAPFVPALASDYTRALENVTTETLATVPGILPVEAIRQAAIEIGHEIVAEYKKPENAAKQINLEYQTKDITQVLYRLEGGESAHQPPKHIYSLPEGVTRVIERARQIAVTMAARMSAVDLEAMVKKAVSFAWKKPENVHEVAVMKSKFVKTPGQDQPKIEQARQRDNERSGPRPGGR